MALFTPPVTGRCPTDYVPAGPGGNDPFYPSALPLRRLLGRYRGELRAPNVFKLTAGGYTTQQPYESTPGSVIAYTYLGGHSYVVTDAEAALLILAGYSVDQTNAVTATVEATV